MRVVVSSAYPYDESCIRSRVEAVALCLTQVLCSIAISEKLEVS